MNFLNLDKIPPFYRHFILLGMGWVITNGANAVTQLHLSTGVASAAGVVLTMAIEVFTPITKQCGVGKGNAAPVNTGDTPVASV